MSIPAKMKKAQWALSKSTLLVAATVLIFQVLVAWGLQWTQASIRIHKIGAASSLAASMEKTYDEYDLAIKALDDGCDQEMAREKLIDIWLKGGLSMSNVNADFFVLASRLVQTRKSTVRHQFSQVLWREAFCNRLGILRLIQEDKTIDEQGKAIFYRIIDGYNKEYRGK